MLTSDSAKLVEKTLEDDHKNERDYVRAVLAGEETILTRLAT